MPKQTAARELGDDVYRVFISYAHHDKPEAERLKKELENTPNVSAHLAEVDTSIRLGTPFDDPLFESLRNSNEFCLLYSRDAQGSEWVLAECGAARALGLPITPILLGKSPDDLPAVIGRHQAVDFYAREEFVGHVSEQAAGAHLSGLLFGAGAQGNCRIIAHCDKEKCLASRVLPPGIELQQILAADHKAHADLNLGLPPANGSEATTFIDAGVLFFVDSPPSNTTVGTILQNCGEWVAGGKIRFEDNASPRGEDGKVLISRGRSFVSNKLDHSREQSDDLAYEDYAVLMKLPGRTAGLTREGAIVWVVFGIHLKGSIAAAKTFSRRNLRQLRTMIRSQLRRMPDYFEVVFRVPEQCDVRGQFSIDGCELVHASALAPRAVEVGADPLPLDQLQLFLERKKWPMIRLDTVHIDPIAHCNLACKGCIEEKERRVFARFSLEAMLEILCGIKRIGCKKVGFYGGEPTLHPQFPRLLDLAVGMDFDVVVVTNGTRLNDPEVLAAVIRNRKALQVRVSLDAATAETHARVHGLDETRAKTKNNLFDYLLTALQRLIQERVYVSISYLLRPTLDGIEGNAGEVLQACKFWDDAGARRFCLRPMTKSGGSHPFLPSEEETVPLRKLLEQYGDFVSTPNWFKEFIQDEKRTSPEQSKSYRTCYSALYRIVISPWIGEVDESMPNDPSMPPETDKAWLSLCSYRRYVPDGFGFELQASAVSGCQEKILNYIARLDPSRLCGEVLCCRHSYNDDVEKHIRRAVR